MKKSRTAALALAALMLCAVLSACSGDTRPSAEIVGAWTAVTDGRGSLTSGSSPMVRDMIAFDNGLMLTSSNGEDWTRMEWGAADGKIALLYPILSDSGDGLAYYDTVYNVVMDYRLEGDSLIIGYELGTAYELIQYEYTRQSDRTV